MNNGQGFGPFEFLKKLTEAAGVSGREERIREMLLHETQGMWDETSIDNMGNLICLKRATRKPPRSAAPKNARRSRNEPEPRAPRVLIACHMDEIGFYVRYIDDHGRLRVQNAGGFDTRNLFARRVLVRGQRDLIGVLNPGGRPIHISTEEDRRKIPEVKDFYVDLFMPAEQVQKLVQIGDPVTLLQNTDLVGDAITGKAMDNRVALWAGINAIRKVHGLSFVGDKSAKHHAPGSAYDIYFVACVQEEVGLRGATTASYTVDPDIGVAIDTTLACDTPGVEKDDSVTTFGGGVAIKVMDSASISHRGLLEEFIEVARRNRIKYQLEVLPRGGTDAGAVQRTRGGTRAITISVPTRYIHTVTEAIHKQDALGAVDLLAAWLSS